jgi:hypothetical protein
MTALNPTPRGRRSTSIDPGRHSTLVVIAIASAGTVASLVAAVVTALGIS